MAELAAPVASVRALLPKAGVPLLRSFDDTSRNTKYSAITAALRASKLSEKKTSERELSRLTGRLMYFMETKLGRDVKQSDRPRITKFPRELFSDFSVGGALFHILCTALSYADEQKWESIDLKNETRLKAHYEMVEKISKVLHRNGLLPSSKVKVFFAPSIPSNEADALQGILVKHGAFVVQTAEVATHLVYADPDGTKESEVDSQVLVRIIEKNSSEALVHWWYHPDSYDDWLKADDVIGIVEEKGEDREGPWHVQARWIRDLDLFNEWMNELDYEIPASADRLLKSPSPKKHANGTVPHEESPISKDSKMRDQPDSPVSEPPSAKRLKTFSLGSDDEDDDREDEEVLSEGDGEKMDLDLSDRSSVDGDAEDKDASEVPSFKVPNFSTWFDVSKINGIEQRALPEYFSGRFESKTPDVYKEIRNCMVNTWRAKPRQYLTATAARNKAMGDSCSILRIHQFLEHWGLINRNVAADTLPLPILCSPPSKLPTMNLVRGSNVPYLFDDGSEACITNSRVFGTSVLGSPRKRPRHPKRRLFEKPLDSDEENESEAEGSPNKGTVDYHCDICNKDCSSLRFHCATKSDMDLCEECYTERKYNTAEMAPRDFIQMKSAGGGRGKQEVDEDVWTESETLLLLEALEMYEDNWSLVAEHVGSKSKDQCVMQFVRLPIEDRFLDNPPGDWWNQAKPKDMAPVDMLRKAGAKEEPLRRVSAKTALPVPYSGRSVIYGGDESSNKLASHALHLSTLTNKKLLAKPYKTMVEGTREIGLAGAFNDLVPGDDGGSIGVQNSENEDIRMEDVHESGTDESISEKAVEKSMEFKITTQEPYEKTKVSLPSAADRAKSDLGELAAEALLQDVEESAELKQHLGNTVEMQKKRSGASVAFAAAAGHADQLARLERAEVDRLVTMAVEIKLKLIRIKLAHYESLSVHDERAKQLISDEAHVRFAREMRAHHRYSIRDPAAIPCLNGPIGCADANSAAARSQSKIAQVYRASEQSENVKATTIRTLTKPEGPMRVSPAEFFEQRMKEHELAERKKEEARLEAERKEKQKREHEAKLIREAHERQERERQELQRRQLAQSLAEANMQAFNNPLHPIAPVVPHANGIAASPAQSGSSQIPNGTAIPMDVQNTPTNKSRSRRRTADMSDDDRSRSRRDEERRGSGSKSRLKKRADVSMDDEEDRISPAQGKSRSKDRRAERRSSKVTDKSTRKEKGEGRVRKRNTRTSMRSAMTELPSIKLRLQLKPVRPVPLKLRMRKKVDDDPLLPRGILLQDIADELDQEMRAVSGQSSGRSNPVW